MNNEDIKRLQAEAMEELKRDMARVEALADPLRAQRKLLAAQLARARYRKKLSQRDLACRLGMKQPDISRIENAKGNPTLDTLLKMAKVLNVNIMVE